MHYSEHLSRRKLLRLLGGSSAVVSAEYLLGLFATPECQAWTDAFTVTPQAVVPKPEGPLGFSFVDVASQCGLGNAVNTDGSLKHKLYILEEMGCGAAFFDYDNDGWIDIFMVNGTRFEGLPAGPAPSNYLFHNNSDGTFTNSGWPCWFFC